MRRVLLICLSLVLALVGWSAVGADDGFYVIPGMKGNYAPVPKTGQTIPYAAGDDGTLRKGVAWPTYRFTDNFNGTVTDNLTRLIWMKNASSLGKQTWANALTAANGLKSGISGLTDGSVKGDWRLPNRKELETLVDCSTVNPAVPAVNPFTNVKSLEYWSSSTSADNTSNAWYVGFYDGNEHSTAKGSSYYVWCVRGGP